MRLILTTILISFCFFAKSQPLSFWQQGESLPIEIDTSYRSLVFDGSNEYVNYSTSINDIINADSSFTINLWFLTNNASNDYLFGDRSALNDRMISFIDGDGKIVYQTISGGVTTSSISTSVLDGDYRDSLWHMATIVVPDGGQPRILIDGDSVGNSIIQAGEGYPNIAGNFQWGATGTGAAPFLGIMTHLSMWQVAMSDEEVNELYNIGGTLYDLTTHSQAVRLKMWAEVKNTSTVSSGGIVDPINAHNGTPTNMESGDIIRNQPNYE